MTSRERVRKAISHEIPDRVPIDIGGTWVTGVHVHEYIELGEYLGFDVELPKVYDLFQMLARVEDPLRSWFHTDILHLENYIEAFEITNRDWKPWTDNQGFQVLVPGGFEPERDERGYLSIRNNSGAIVGEMAPSSVYFDKYIDLESYIPPEDVLMSPEEYALSISLYSDEELKILEKRGKSLFEDTDYAVCGSYHKMHMHTTAGLYAGHKFEDWLCRLFTDPNYVYEVLEAVAERNIENLKLYLQAVGDYIDIILVSTTDYGSQIGEIYSPEMFRELVKPNIKKVNDFIHQNCAAKTFYHSCGSIRNIIGDMIEAGVDILNPVQVNTSNMDAAELKRDFGDRIVFWGGGVDTQTVFQFGTPEEVRAQVKERVEIFGKGGGFVFTPVHNIQSGVPLENLVAMRDAVLEYGKY